MVAGEIGQTSIDYQGKDFVYGNKGALEAYVGIWHIAERKCCKNLILPKNPVFAENRLA